MTEQEWQASTSAKGMLLLIWQQASKRKLRLFACGCARTTIWHLLVDERSRNAVQVAEQAADGLVSENALEMAFSAAMNAAKANSVNRHEIKTTENEAMELAAMTAWKDLFGAAFHWSAAWWTKEIFAAGKMEARHHQCLLLHCVFGPQPLRPLTIPPMCRTSTVVSLAQTIYDDRTFDRLPILGDALEEAGCANGDILAHCRGHGPHVRGCWVIDLLLGKE